MDGGLRLSNIVRNYIHADRGDMPAERQVTWRGCARDWITEGEVFKLANVRLICWQKIIKLGLLRHGKK